MHLRISHRTLYHYSAPSVESYNEVRLEPVSDDCQICKRFDVFSNPVANIFSFDEIGGVVHHFTLREPHLQLEIQAEAEVETLCSNPFEGLNLLEPDFDFYVSDDVRNRFAEYLVPSRFVPISSEVSELAASVMARANGVATQFLLQMSRTLYDFLDYDPDVTHVHSTVDEVLALKAGVCQDFAHVMIACCRSVGIPAKYVSGYLYCSRGSGIRGADAMHAWVECPLPDGRVLSLDPTNNLLANEHHIRVHTGRDYGDITPLQGLYKGRSAQKLDVEIRVEEILDVQQDIA